MTNVSAFEIYEKLLIKNKIYQPNLDAVIVLP